MPAFNTQSTSSSGASDMTPSIEKQRRYDRGIRVWGAHGQQALEQARVCLLTAGPTGSEALKNLVLGGIHSFTIVDGNKVQPTDVGSNYLVTIAALGTSRAACVTECLKELNESVAGSYIEQDPGELIASNPAFFSEFDLVIATQLPEASAFALDTVCRTQDIRLLLARSYGLVGYVRNCVAEHLVIESKPDSQVDDLRATSAWPELLAAAEAVKLDELDEAEHSHVPYGKLAWPFSLLFYLLWWW
jgi:NEDD8-activating enzyme E1 regulatory subunit